MMSGKPSSMEKLERLSRISKPQADHFQLLENVHARKQKQGETFF